MKNSKKIMLISGIIGIGTGLFISGIVLSILIYTVSGNELINRTNIEDVQQNKTPPQEIPELTQKNELVESKPKNLEIEKKEPEEIKSEEIKPVFETITIEIGEMATARQIAAILEEQGVVSDSNDFLTYIISKKADRFLFHGTKEFILNSDNEAALKVLTTYE